MSQNGYINANNNFVYTSSYKNRYPDVAEWLYNISRTDDNVPIEIDMNYDVIYMKLNFFLKIEFFLFLIIS